jgi:diguanylate cyclase (GGDEF)-like protein
MAFNYAKGTLLPRQSRSTLLDVTANKPLIFIVDDDSLTVNALTRVLSSEWDIRSFSNPEKALIALQSEDPALILSDYSMPEMSGLDFLQKSRTLRPSSVRVLLSGVIDNSELSQAISRKLIHRFFLKPWENSILQLQLKECLAQRHLLLEKENLAELALTDPVTGLGNLRLFQDQLRIEVDRAKRHKRALSLIMLDIDHFKDWNDSFGHPAGNKLLAKLAKLLLTELRSVDWVARYGGDEFAIILPDTKIEHAIEVSERLRKAAMQLEKSPDPDAAPSVALSLGVATFPDHGEDSKELTRSADQALLKAKKSGRNQTQTAAPV